ncbi:MAG: PD-(D/E)XK nuclease family protein [Ferruginibacter sp.]
MTNDIRLTETIALRIAKILSATNASPGEILCITSTTGAGIALQKRLDQLFGDDPCRLNIYTINSFCEKLLQENAPLFANESPVLISLLEHIRLLKELIAGFPKEHPLKRYRGDVYHEINYLKRLFSIIKTNGRTTGYLIEQIEVWLSKFNLGNEDEAANLTMITKLLAGISEFDNYQKLLQISNRYDADDAVRLAAALLEKNTNLLAELRQKFKYIHADENSMYGPADNFLKILIGDDQTANVLLVNRINKDEQQPLFQPKALKNFQPGSPLTEQLKPVILSYQSISEEIARTTSQVYNLLQQNIDPGKIVIVYSNSRYAEKLEHSLAAKNISFYSRQVINILTDPFLHKTIQLLEYIDREHAMPFSGDDLLFEILHFDFFKVPVFEITSLAIEAGNKKRSITAKAMRQLLLDRVNRPARDLFDIGISNELKGVSAILEKLIANVANSTPLELFENIIIDISIKSYIGQNHNSNWLIQLLATFTDFIRIEVSREPRLQLTDLLEVIDTMQKENISLPVTRTTGNLNNIQLIDAKEIVALQFDYVFISGANAPLAKADDWVNYIYKIPGTFLIPPDQTHGTSLLPLIYPGQLTSLPQLTISFAKFDDKNKPLEPAAFATEIISCQSTPLQIIEINDNGLKDKVAFHSIRLQPEIAQPEKGIISPLLSRFVISVSSLNSYLNCPLGFYYKNIIRIPAARNEAMEFGSAVHYALEKLFKKMSAGDQLTGRATKQYQFSPVAEMVADFESYLHSRRSFFTSESFDRRLQYGNLVLRNYYKHYIDNWNKVVSIERNISGVSINGVPLKGKLDKLEFDGTVVNIVDYKTGDLEKARSKLKPPNEDDPNGGDYWRQAVFYKILVDNYEQKKWKVRSVEFDFIEPGIDNKYYKENILFTAADVETVKQQITNAWRKIQACEFYIGCGKHDCHWCNFVKNNNLAVALHRKEKEPGGY